MSKLFWTPPEEESMCGRTHRVCYAWESQADVDFILSEQAGPNRPMPILSLTYSESRKDWSFFEVCDLQGDSDLTEWFYRNLDRSAREALCGSLSVTKRILEELLVDVNLEDPL